MKIIISRKGSDSGEKSGGMASPILPCGCLCSIPIPYEKGGVPFADIRFGGYALDQLCSGLNPKWQGRPAHLDPDLRFESLPPEMRPKGWRAAFGQSGAAASHLSNQGVGRGDLFIFFGWFRHTEIVGNRLRFRDDDKQGRHIIYGWLRVEEVLEVGLRKMPRHLQFLAEHAHVRFKEKKPNSIYVGSDAGVFAKEQEELVLTNPNSRNRSDWKLPLAFDSVFRQPTLTYHGNKNRWSLDRGEICLETVGRGQEFVLSCEKHPEVWEHFLNLIKSNRECSTCTHNFDS